VDGAVAPTDRPQRLLAMMLDELVTWTDALRTVREGVRT
jgi:hypothetical protein